MIDIKNQNPDDFSGYMPVIDVQGGIKRLVNNKALYLKLLKSFNGQKMADDIINAVQSGDFQQIAAAAHTLKGVCANLGLIQLAEASAGIESRAKSETQSDDLIGPLNESLKETLRLIEQLLQN